MIYEENAIHDDALQRAAMDDTDLKTAWDSMGGT
jgi:hypothetical protein